MKTPCLVANEEAVRLVLAHRTMLRAFLKGIIYDPALVEDTFSDVILAVLNSWHRYEPERPFGPWARGVARRVALSNLRKQARQPCLLDEDVLEAVALEIDRLGSEVELEVCKEALHRCVERLPKRHRLLIQLRYFEDCSYQQISQTVGKTINTLYVIFNRMHLRLSLCIKRELNQP